MQILFPAYNWLFSWHYENGGVWFNPEKTIRLIRWWWWVASIFSVAMIFHCKRGVLAGHLLSSPNDYAGHFNHVGGKLAGVFSWIRWQREEISFGWWVHQALNQWLKRPLYKSVIILYWLRGKCQAKSGLSQYYKSKNVTILYWLREYTKTRMTELPQMRKSRVTILYWLGGMPSRRGWPFCNDLLS